MHFIPPRTLCFGVSRRVIIQIFLFGTQKKRIASQRRVFQHKYIIITKNTYTDFCQQV